MKKILFVLGITTLLFSCGEGGENSADAIDPNGPVVELNVISFSLEDNKTELEIINRLDEDINNVRGRLMFMDNEGNQLTTATGRELTSPFSHAKNPKIVGSMSKSTITLSNTIEAGTENISITEIVVTTKSGVKINVD